MNSRSLKGTRLGDACARGNNCVLRKCRHTQTEKGARGYRTAWLIIQSFDKKRKARRIFTVPVSPPFVAKNCKSDDRMLSRNDFNSFIIEIIREKFHILCANEIYIMHAVITHQRYFPTSNTSDYLYVVSFLWLPVMINFLIPDLERAAKKWFLWYMYIIHYSFKNKGTMKFYIFS